MATNSFNTKDMDRKWYVLDAEGIILGRLATVAADLLRGKNKATYTPNFDGGDNVVILNAAKVMLSSERKREAKTYYRHSGYPGGIKKETFRESQEKHPEKTVFLAVKGMLPKTKLADSQIKRLRVYADATHKHTQELTEVDLKATSRKGDQNDR